MIRARENSRCGKPVDETRASFCSRIERNHGVPPVRFQAPLNWVAWHDLRMENVKAGFAGRYWRRRRLLIAPPSTARDIDR